jgi:hypothetical protein
LLLLLPQLAAADPARRANWQQRFALSLLATRRTLQAAA